MSLRIKKHFPAPCLQSSGSKGITESMEKNMSYHFNRILFMKGSYFFYTIGRDFIMNVPDIL